MDYKTLLVLLFLGISSVVFSQEETNISENEYTYNKNKGKAYFYWGGNRALFSKSDIHFKGANYDFTLQDVNAKDKPKGWHIDYINPARMTIPQTNFRLGYYIYDNYQISFGFDHMKYVVERPQNVTINGYINFNGIEEGDVNYNGVYNNDTINLIDTIGPDGNPTFFAFEYTDGLNYVNIEIARVDDLGEYLNLNPNKIQINLLEGIGIGGLYPKTNATIIGKPRNDEFSWSGYGISVKAGLNLTFFEHFMIQTELKGGFINMPWVKTTIDGDTAKQQFWFIQHNITVGYVFQLFNNSKKNNINLN
ncbi:MAG: hypothetical protein HRT69_05770 [Flavobacteriaceae bacterium]|nr:hypothetical protein [Flavobacteriaceae bacterium]